MAYWLARDSKKRNRLFLFDRKPTLYKECFDCNCDNCEHIKGSYSCEGSDFSDGKDCKIELPKSWHPEVAYENSPVKITGVIIETKRKANK